ncbi:MULTISPECIES: hypothetical protein [Pseudomonas]|uniref:hypothetical protein n=1 Tax=Pseudomonas TaxID=286 RepID=UPI0012601878|nr:MULTISPECIES: hypothetical protein [Pseudomonas]
MKIRFVYLCFLFILPPLQTWADDYPWLPDPSCKLRKPHPEGLYPNALTGLNKLGLSARITQAWNPAPAASNVHGTDSAIDGVAYTGAVDLSTRCLDETQIKRLLKELTNTGFIAWYRKDGVDGWTGSNHVHAVWVGDTLKTVLRRQVTSWTKRKNGLRSDLEYQFWQADDATIEAIKTRYDAANH